MPMVECSSLADSRRSPPQFFLMLLLESPVNSLLYIFSAMLWKTCYTLRLFLELVQKKLALMLAARASPSDLSTDLYCYKSHLVAAMVMMTFSLAKLRTSCSQVETLSKDWRLLMAQVSRTAPAPWQIVPVRLRNLSCPAVSQICIFILNPFISTVLTLKSMPIVAMWVGEQSALTYLRSRLVLPTAESPITATLAMASQSFFIIIIQTHVIYKIIYQRGSIMRLSSLLLMAVLLAAIFAQPDCAAKAFPPLIPMARGENQLLDLQNYFEGNNISFSVSPNNSFSYVDRGYECRKVSRDNLGRVVASKYLRKEQLLGTLSESITGRFTFASLQVDSQTLSTLDLPNNLPYTNCTDFDLTPSNNTHFQLVVTCRDTSALFSRALLFATFRLNEKEFVDWAIKTSPQFSYTEVLSCQVLLVDGEMLIRAVSTSANSYIQLWTWTEDYKEVIGIVDKTTLGVNLFNLKAIRIYDSLVILLDYHFGLHVLHLSKGKKLSLRGQIAEPFFEEFSYDVASGLLLLAKKGKVVSAVVKNLQHSNIAVGMSFNLFNYRRILKVADLQNKLIVLDDSLLNVFSVNGNQNAYKHYNFYPSQNTTHFFLQQTQGKPLNLLLVQNNDYDVIHLICTLRSPLLHLSAPPIEQEVTVTGKSVVNGDTSICQQTFVLSMFSTQAEMIYNNGYSADNQVLFANLPGEGVIELQKYGVGKNVQYRVTTDPSTKLEYSFDIRKNQAANCTIQNRPIPQVGTFSFHRTWENILVAQLNSDYNLKYFICNLDKGVACSYAVQIPNLGPIDDSAYQLIQKTPEYSVSFQALLRQNPPDYNILVRKLLIQPQAGILQISVYCTINIPNYLKEYTNVTQIDINNGLLYVVMPFVKEIRIYDIGDKDCPNVAILGVGSFKGDYFSPREIFFDSSYNNYRQPMLFVKQWNQLLSLKLQGSELKPRIINKNLLPQSKNGSAVISLPYLVYLSFTYNSIAIFRFDDQHQLLPLRKIQLADDIQFASTGDKKDSYQLLDETHLALKVVNTTSFQQHVKIYSFQELISAAVQYTNVPISDTNEIFSFFHQSNSHKTLILVELVSEASSNFLTCQSYDLHLQPSVLFNFEGIRSTITVYSQNITLDLLTRDDERTHQFEVSLTNLGQGISRGTTFPGRGTSVQASSELVFEDSYWFKGSIYNYDFDCRNCKDRIKFNPKIREESKQDLPFSSDKFFLNHKEKILHATANSFLVEMQYNFSAWPIPEVPHSQYKDIPDSKYELKQIFALSLGEVECIDTIMVEQKHILITLCWRLDPQKQKEYFLSLVSTVSSKSFILAETVLKFQDESTPKMQYKSNIVVVYSPNIAIILTIWNIQDSLTFVQLDQIDRQDIADTICASELISNDTSLHTDLTHILYTLAVTQCNNQLYYTSFAVYLQQQQIIDEEGVISTFSVPNIHVSYGQNVNLPKIWSQKGIQIPSDARIIQTLTKKEQSQFSTQEVFSFFVLFDRFHSYQFKMTLSKQNRIIKAILLDSVFYKFGSNIATSAFLQDYLVVKYVLDFGFGKLEELYGCFNISNYVVSKDLIKQHYHFATYVFKNFKKTQEKQSFSAEESFPWYLDGHRIFQLHHEHLEVLNITSQLTATIEDLDNPENQLYTQSIVVTSSNPISARSATIILKSIDEFILTDMQIALIVIAGIALVIVVVLLGRVLVRKLKKRLKLVPLAHHSNAEDQKLEWEEEERAGEWKINATDRGSTEPRDIQ